MKTDVTSLDNAKAGTIDLDAAIFDVPARADILHRVVNWQLAKRRSGNHKTRGVSEIRGTTAKPFKQKGTGRARQGSRRSPQMRGGAVIFGPVVRSHEHALPKKVRKLGLKIALSAKRHDGRLAILDRATLDEAKTSILAKKLSQLGWGSALIVDGPDIDVNFSRAAANLPGIDVLPHQGLNVYDIMRRDTLVLTRAAVERIEERLR